MIELSMVFIAGGAGLQLGWALLNPGPYTRRDSLALAARRAVTLAVASIVLRAGVGLATGILLYSYLGLAGRKKTGAVGMVSNTNPAAGR